jgi:hypothetical protein
LAPAPFADRTDQRYPPHAAAQSLQLRLIFRERSCVRFRCAAEISDGKNMNKKPRPIPHPASAPGDFYVENGVCLICGVPHVVAPDLIGWQDARMRHCIWKTQPETPKEFEQAFKVFEVQEAGCHRYAGTDQSILERIPPEFCDNPLRPTPAFHPSTRSRTPSTYFELLDQSTGFLLRFWRRLTRSKTV